MYSQEEKKQFMEVAESLKKYRRADLIDEDGKDILDKLYVDLLDGNVILNKCLLDNTTFLIGRKGTGKSTLFLKLEREYRKKKRYLPCYVDVKSVFESSQAQAINQQYLNDFFENEALAKYLLGRNFMQSVLKTIYGEIDKQYRSMSEKILAKVKGNTNDAIKDMIDHMLQKIENNEIFKQIEIPVLQQVKKQRSNTNKSNEANIVEIGGGISLENAIPTVNYRGTHSANMSYEDETRNCNEYTEIYLKVFEIKEVIKQIKDILKRMDITKLVLLLDDVSEIDSVALRMFIDTIVAPLNNWSDEFIKFKIAFYPGRVHYGKIDPGKIDIINLDFYNLYSEFDSNKMEENAVNFTKRLLENHFLYFSGHIEKFFAPKTTMDEIYSLFFRASMNVPRIMGYLLSYLYQSTIIYGKQITRNEIESAAEKYYVEKIDAFFEASTYCLLSLDEEKNIEQLKKIRDAIVGRSKDIKSMITKGELTGKLYVKSAPYSSHFHILQENDRYLESLELNHFITKYEEKANRDGKPTNVYCLNYGLCKKNNIVWGKPQGVDARTYFIERPFNFTNLVLEQIKEIKKIKCTNLECGRVFSENDIPGLTFNGFKCPSCGGTVETEIIIDRNVEQALERDANLPLLSKIELEILLELNSGDNYMLAREIAEEVDANSYRISWLCKKMAEEKGLIERKKLDPLYEYKISERGKEYFGT